jgi:hypothetical protein
MSKNDRDINTECSFPNNDTTVKTGAITDPAIAAHAHTPNTKANNIVNIFNVINIVDSGSISYPPSKPRNSRDGLAI